MITLSITLATAGAAALINLWLAQRVGKMRGVAGVSIGDGGHELLIARMRAHANFVEYTPFVLILIGLIELARGSLNWLWVVSALYLLGRIAHGLGMGSSSPYRLRMIGTVVTMLTLLGLGLYAIAIPYLGPEGQPTPTPTVLPA